MLIQLERTNRERCKRSMMEGEQFNRLYRESCNARTSVIITTLTRVYKIFARTQHDEITRTYCKCLAGVSHRSLPTPVPRIVSIYELCRPYRLDLQFLGLPVSESYVKRVYVKCNIVSTP
jgi:hypothetical protein